MVGLISFFKKYTQEVDTIKKLWNKNGTHCSGRWGPEELVRFQNIFHEKSGSLLLIGVVNSRRRLRSHANPSFNMHLHGMETKYSKNKKAHVPCKVFLIIGISL